MDITKQIINMTNELKAARIKEEQRAKKAREASKKYYNKNYSLGENPTEDEIKKQMKLIEKRDKYQKSYYEKNKEKILLRQREYRKKKKQEEETNVL
tara:strand:+ start:79 stop:369 length:291 start_codon:yes stop_codon:yes gene_type:complete